MNKKYFLCVNTVIPDTRLIASVNHVAEFLLVSTPGDQVVTDRLISLFPWPVRVGHHGVLTWWGNLLYII